MPDQQEHFTPSGWAIIGPYGTLKKVYRITSVITDLTVATAFSEADARLIAEAPNMFALLKEYLVDHTALRGGDLCDCTFCQSARRLMARVLQGEEK